MKKKILKTSLAFMLSITTIMTSSIPSFAMEVNDNNTEYQTLTDKLESILPEEEIKEVNTIEQLDTKDVASNDNSAFKSCRLIVYSESELTFKDDIGKDNIKSVQKLNELNAYVVTYSSFKEAEKAFNNYVSQGIEVEVDMVSDTPKGVENKDERDNEVEDEKIASTNENKDTKSLDKLNELEEKKDIVVAVLDTGLNDGEDIFTDRIIEGKNFVDDSDDVVDKNGHGTTMSRIVLTNVNNADSELTEVDKSKTYILPIKVLNDKGIGTTLSAYKGIKYAIEKKVDVINLSLSGIGHSKLLESAINEAYNNNIPVVVSSGNDNKEITDYTPANIDSAITIGSAVQSNTKGGVLNNGTLNLSGGPLINANKADGVTNKGTMKMTDGAIYDNDAYGVNNTGTFTFTSEQIHDNKGTKPTNDTCNVGVYQNGTFTIGNSARVHSNSVYLAGTSRKVKQDSGSFTGSAVLTTSTGDRNVGREPVTNSSSASTSKYSLV